MADAVPTAGDLARTPATLVEMLRARSCIHPDGRIFTFLASGEEESESLTYVELDRRARALASCLQAEAAPQDRALLLYPAGLEFIAAFFGTLYAGLVAVPTYPPPSARLARSLPRLLALIGDSRPRIALTDSSLLSKLRGAFAEAPELGRLRWIATDDMGAGDGASWRDPRVSGEDLAFLQYTSGSTAAPRGVMVTHRNVLENGALMERAFGREGPIVSWLPPYHDMGLIGHILQPIFMDAPCVLIPPASFLQRPLRWLEAISRHRARLSGGPNFAYELCLERITDAQRGRLDLGSWEVAYNGAEPVRAETLTRFAAAFASCGLRPQALYPCYGLAEATLFVSGGKRGTLPLVRGFDGDALASGRAVPSPSSGPRLVACGAPSLDCAIVDPESGKRCAAGRVGEIWLSGPSVAKGYWNQPEETGRAFDARLASGEGPFLRTGDLGFVHDGQLFVAGRLKDLIIIAGRNHYPQDIERTAEESHPALRPASCAAFSIDVEGTEQLVLVAELDPRFRDRASPTAEARGIATAVRQAIAERHEVQLHAFVPAAMGAVPKTSSGKVRRRECRALYLSGAFGEPL